MKKAILISALSFFTFSTVTFAQESKTSTQANSGKKEDCVMMKDGKVMMMKDGKTTAMDKETTLSNGTKVMADGSYTTKDGKKMKLKDGECMSMKGEMMQNKDAHSKDDGHGHGADAHGKDAHGHDKK